MSALSISVPYPVFSGQDGLPLDNGYVWIGTANLYPITNQIAVYFDEALTIQATQPLRTINGFISNAGTPAQVYVDGVNFSILVQDSKGSMVYNFLDGSGVSPNATGISFVGFNGQIGTVQDLADDDGSDWIGFLQSGTGAVAESVQEKLRQTISVIDFGADPTGVADSGPAFNTALSVFRSVIVPAGTYLIKTQIVIPSGAMLFGQTGFVPSGSTNGGAKIKYHADLGVNPMIWCQDTSWISNLAFEGAGKGTGTAIKNKKTNTGQLSYEDMDCTIQGCTFNGWDISVDHWNRGLWFDSNVSALVTTSVNLNVDTANWINDPSNPFDLPDQGFRAIRITNNRLHANTAAIVNTGTGREYLRGLSVVGNQIDIGDNLFSGFCHTSLFTGNVLDQVGTAALDFYGDVYGLTISGNTFGGDTPSGQNYPLYLIRFRNTANNITINGNTFRNTDAHGILFEDALSQSTITGNTFYNIGVDAVATDACIKTQSTFTDVTITGNSFFPVTAPFGVRGITTEAWTRVIVDNNVWDTTKTLAAQYLQTGTNYIQGEVVASPTQLTADVNNYAPSNASTWRLSSDASRSITGIFSTYVMVGRILTIINVGSNDIVLKNLSASSNDANKIITGTGADITLAANQTAQLLYDFTTSRWRVINTN